MPDVGVLQLKISSDASSASKSLGNLYTKLSNLNTLAAGFNLSTVAEQIKSIVDTVKGDKQVSTAVKNLGTLLNAIAGFSKVKSIGISEDQLRGLESLQNFANGLKLGQAGTQLNKLREALGGEWNTDQAEKARQAMETLAQGASAMEAADTAKKAKTVAESVKDMTDASGTGVQDAKADVVDYQKAIDELADTTKEASKITFKEPLMKLNLQQFGEKPNVPKFENESVQNWRDEMAAIKGLNNEIKNTDSSSVNNILSLQGALADFMKIKGLGANLNKIADGIVAITGAAKNIGESHLTLNRISDAINKLSEVSTGFKLPNFTNLESLAKVLQDNFNAESGLKRLADGISAFRRATEGMNLGNTKSLVNAVKAMNASEAQSAGKVTEGFAEAKSEIKEVMVATKDANASIAETGNEMKTVNTDVTESLSETERMQRALEDTRSTAQMLADQFANSREITNSYVKDITAVIPVLREYRELVASMESRKDVAGFSKKTGDELIGAMKPAEESTKTVEQNMGAATQAIRESIASTAELTRETQNTNDALAEQIRIRQQRNEAEKQERLERNYEKYRAAYQSGEGPWKETVPEMYGFTPKAIEENETYADALRATLKEVDEYVDKFIEKMNTPSGELFSDVIKKAFDAKLSFKDAADSASVLKNVVDLDSGTVGVKSSTQKLGQSFNDGRQKASALTGEMKTLDRELRQKKTDLEDVANSAGHTSKSFSELMFGADGLRGGFKRMFPTITGLLHRFKSLMTYRALRAVLRHIADGFKTGYENFKQYSEAMGTDFSANLNNANAQLLTMKNSIGAAVAPAIQAALPLLQMLTSFAITAFNAVNQLLSLLQGKSTWTKATEASADSLKNVQKSAGGAGSAVKDLLASWDELNIIQSESGGGGGGGGSGAAEDYLNMFREVSEYEGWIKDTVEFIRNNFDVIKQAAIDIGLAILGWKISSAFGGVLGLLGNLLALGAVVDITIRLTNAFAKEYVKTGDAGWFIADVLTGALGASLAGAIARKIAGGQWGLITAGFTVMLEGSVNLKASLSASAQQKDAEAQMTRILGSVEEGIGAALILKGFTASTPFSLAVGAAVALFTYTINTLASVNITGIKWGTKSLTDEEIRQFVQKEMFRGDIEAQIKITKAAITLSQDERRLLEEQATALLVPLNSLVLGVDIEGSLEQIRTGIFGENGLIAQFKSTLSAQKALVGTAETYVPTIDATGTNISGQIMEEAGSAWTELAEMMDDLGSELSMHLTRAMDSTLSEELRTFEMHAVEEITDTMIRVSLAGKRATVGSDALTDLAFSLADSDQLTFSGILTVFEEYRRQLTEQNTEIKKEEAASFASLAAQYNEFAEGLLRRNGNDTTDPLYQHYIQRAQEFATQYQTIMENIATSVEDSVNESVEPGKATVKKAVLEMLSEAKEVWDGKRGLFTGGKIGGLYTGLAGGFSDELRQAMGMVETRVNLGYMEDGIPENLEDLRNSYNEWLYTVIKEFFPTDHEYIRRMIEDGLLDFEDIFNPETMFDTMTSQGRNGELYKRLWNMFYGDKTDAAHAAQEVSEEVKDAFANGFTGTEHVIEAIKAGIVLEPEVSVDVETPIANAIDEAMQNIQLDTLELTKKVYISFDVDEEENYPPSWWGRLYKPGSHIEELGYPTEMKSTYGTAEDNDVEESVSRGTAQGFSSVAVLLTQANSLLTALLNKEFTARVAPSAGNGKGMANALNAYSRMTGNEVYNG